MEQEKDVTVDPSTTTEAVTEVVETTQPETSAAQETEQQPQADAQESVQTVTQPTFDPNLYDESGVPWKNRAMEYTRKLQEKEQNLPKLIAEEVAKLTQTQTTPKYTVRDLEIYAHENKDNPQIQAFVAEEKQKLLEESLMAKFEAKTNETVRAKEAEIVKSQVFNQVINDFPDIAIKDQQGRFVGWNNANPLTQKIGQYMSDPELASRPNGLAIAAKLAYADVALQKVPTQQKQVQKLKAQVKKVQQQTMLEGGGRKVTETITPIKKAVDAVRNTGSRDDAQSAMAHILGLK